MRTPLSICPPSSRVSPVCYPQNPSGGDTLGSRTLSGVASLCHLSLWCKKNRAHQRLRTLVWCSALPSSSPLLLAFRLRTSECLYNNATNRQSNKKSTPNGVLFFLFKTPLTPKLNRCRCRSCQLPQQCRLKGLRSL